MPRKNLLEVGVYLGGSIGVFLKNNPNWHATGIDPYPGLEEASIEMFEYLRSLQVDSRFKLFDSWSGLMVNSTLPPTIRFDLIHIDGEHSEAAVATDLEFAHRLLSEEGLLIIDDFMSRPFPGVTNATLLFLRNSNLAPLLLTESKLYLCNSSKFDFYTEQLVSLLNQIGLKYNRGFEVGQFGEAYEQSNSINGYRMLQVNRQDSSKFESFVGLNVPREKCREIVKLLLPPFLYSALKFALRKSLR